MMEKMKVSYQAFLEQIQNWQLTLTRENKKLKALRNQITNRIFANQIDIIITQIQAQTINYRKLKQFKTIHNIDVIEQYNITSKKFMDLMESIGNIAEKADNIAKNDQTLILDSSDYSQDNEATNNQIFDDCSYGKIKIKSSLDFSKMKNKTKGVLSKKNSFQKKTFNKNRSIIPSRDNSRKHVNKSALRIDQSDAQNMENFDAWEIKYQLKQIKSMMAQIQNQIKYHNHEDIESELIKIQHNNKKMGLELKSLRDDSQYVINRIQKIKQEVLVEKKIQAQMIEQFENPQRKNSVPNSHSRRRNTSLYSHSRSQHHQTSYNQDVSDWVKIRI